jgi:hypothetical protein
MASQIIPYAGVRNRRLHARILLVAAGEQKQRQVVREAAAKVRMAVVAGERRKPLVTRLPRV